jgi:hypothetical protein
MMRGRPPLEPKTEHCIEPGCELPVNARNLCKKHYVKTRRPKRCPAGIRHIWTLMRVCKACGATRDPI